VSQSTVTVTVKDTDGNGIIGHTLTFSRELRQRR
jgi:hypothetical protein